MKNQLSKAIIVLDDVNSNPPTHYLKGKEKEKNFKIQLKQKEG